MEYSQFVDDVKRCICFRVEKDYEVKVNRVIKNNSVELDGIVFFRDGDSVSPNIYLNSYYERYQEGESVEKIAGDIINLYERSKGGQAEEYSDFSFDFEEIKDKIIYRLVNYQKNKKLLKEVPHIRFIDLAITFHCLVKQDADGIGTIRINKEHMELWQVSAKELMQLAARNTSTLFPIKINTMEEVISDILRKDIKQMCVGTPGAMEEEMLEMMLGELMGKKAEQPMWIMSNVVGINGATSLIYKDTVKEFANRFGQDFYILPSSIHEVILVPYDESLEVENLRKMVSDVNLSQVPEEEVLSNRVYIYRRGTNSIEIA